MTKTKKSHKKKQRKEVGGGYGKVSVPTGRGAEKKEKDSKT